MLPYEGWFSKSLILVILNINIVLPAKWVMLVNRIVSNPLHPVDRASTLPMQSHCESAFAGNSMKRTSKGPTVVNKARYCKMFCRAKALALA